MRALLKADRKQEIYQSSLGYKKEPLILYSFELFTLKDSIRNELQYNKVISHRASDKAIQ
jgi:hypothetical protein